MLTFPSSIHELLRSLLLDSPEFRATFATYKAGSIILGIGLISVPSSFSIRCRSNLSSYVIKLIAIPVICLKMLVKFMFYRCMYGSIPKCPNRPERPIRCKYVSAIRGKSKFITTLTAWTSIPRVNKSEQTRLRHKPCLKS